MRDDKKTRNAAIQLPTLSDEELQREGVAPTLAGTDVTQVDATELPLLADRTIVNSLETNGVELRGVKLRDLPEDPPLPELAAGSSKYQILRILGEGGMGTVYLAVDRDLNRHVAVKMMREHKTALTVRFLEEAQVMAQLQHPSIVPVHDVGLSEDGRIFYTMPVVHGKTLREILNHRRNLHNASTDFSLTHLIQILQTVTQAVSYAHDKGVLHRDLKPANIMIGDHGEVQVLDWGLFDLLKDTDVVTNRRLGADEVRGRTLGTPAYMSPEQARGDPVDTRTDVYALGSILYEILTLQPPFGGTVVEILRAVMDERPIPPSRIARDRMVPRQLEKICLQALSKNPADRQSSARELHRGLQAWLEVEADKAQRHERAQERVSEARQAFARYRRLKQQVAELKKTQEETRATFKSWQPISEKGKLLDAEAKTQETSQQLVQCASETVTKLTEALGFEADNSEARETLADFYWDRFLEAEGHGDAESMHFFSDLVRTFHDGKYEAELLGDGSLSLRTIPGSAEVWLSRYVEDGFVSKETEPQVIGKTPLKQHPLPMGSYMLTLKYPGRRDTRYPIFITRNRAWKGSVKLLTDRQIGPGMVHVPAGPFVRGGDPATMGRCLPRAEIEVADFFISIHPVTILEYLEFLNELVREEGLKTAMKHSPRLAAEGPFYLETTGQGLLQIPQTPDAEGDVWSPNMPVVCIDRHDAELYCQWKSRKDGRMFRLPSETEWEKAARGVDGRWFPWGNRFDHSMCNLIDSRRERCSAVSVGEFPYDESVYGVRGMAGNSQDWTSSLDVSGEGATQRTGCLVRGGGWAEEDITARCAYRDKKTPGYLWGCIGFRLVSSDPAAG